MKVVSDLRSMISKKLFSALIAALFVYGTFVSLVHLGIHVDVVGDAALGAPFLALGVLMFAASIPWLMNLLGLDRQWQWTISVRVGSLLIGIPAWCYVVLAVN